MGLDLDRIAALPKVALHDHLDGGLRPATVLELAEQAGHPLPAQTPQELGEWFAAAASSGSLVSYLTTFEHTVAVLQTPQALQRVAAEFVADLAADGVVYAEARWAPAQHTAGGLTQGQAVAAVASGLREGMAVAQQAGRPILARQLLTALRHHQPSVEVAHLASDADDVAGFDIAGPEAGYPPSRLAPALAHLRRHGVPYTIHAGEADGVASIADAIECGATRIGHGARLVEDLELTPDGWVLGETASAVRERGIVLELCPSSNLQTGVCDTVAQHPFGRLADAGFRVTINCDNRLMSATTMTREAALLADAFDYGLADLRRFTLDAISGAFLDDAERRRIVEQYILPGFAAA